ncbi:MAG TPA: hypothetical protein VII37_09390 [Candidatus Acidoferrum sp.]
MGRFLGGLLARGAVRAAVSNSHSSTPLKSYTSDVLTVEQLATCIKKAGKLDGESTRLDAERGSLLALTSQVELSSTAIEFQRSRIDQYSKASVDAFNASIGTHNRLVMNAKARNAEFNSGIDKHNGEANAFNSECAKKYYAEDLADAQKLAASN